MNHVQVTCLKSCALDKVMEAVLIQSTLHFNLWVPYVHVLAELYLVEHQNYETLRPHSLYLLCDPPT
jgi:hypothetical protein